MLTGAAETLNIRDEHMPCSEHERRVAVAERRKHADILNKRIVDILKTNLKFVFFTGNKDGIRIIAREAALKVTGKIIEMLRLHRDACGFGMAAEALKILRYFG